MSATAVTIIYPKGTKFNMDYYLTKHMPLAQAKWTQYGLKSCKVVQYSEDAPYCVQALLEFDSVESWTKAATSAEAKDVLNDVANFADRSPSTWVGATLKDQSC